MKQKGMKATAATALLSAAILGGPMAGSAHGGPGHDKGHSKDYKQSYQTMENYKQKDKRDKHWKREGHRDRGDRGFRQANFDRHGENSKHVERVQGRDNGRVESANSQRKENAKSRVDKVRADKPNKIIPTPAPVPAVTVADVTAFGDEHVLPYVNALDTAEANVNWEGVQKNYRVLSVNVKKVAKLIDKLENSEEKANLINRYVVPGEEALSDVKLALKAHKTLQNAENQYAKGKANKAVWKLIKAKVLTNRLDRGADDPLQANLQSRINSLQAKIKESYNTNVDEVSL